MKSDLAEVRNWLSQGANEKEIQEQKRRKQVAVLNQEADLLARDVAAMREAASIIERAMGPEGVDGGGGLTAAGIGLGRIYPGEILPGYGMENAESAPTVTKPWEMNVKPGPSRG